MIGCFFQTKCFGIHSFQKSQSQSGEDHQQDQIHQESKSAAIGKCFLCRMKITEKYSKIRWIENTGMVHQRLDFTYNNQQKPP